MSHRETIVLVSTLAVVAALFPAFFSYVGKDAVSKPTTSSTPLPITPPNHVSLRALVPYLLAVPRAIIAVPSKPLGAIASWIVLVVAPALVVLDALLYVIVLPFSALSVLIRTLYPIYVLCGAAILTGAILGGVVVGCVKFVLLVQEVRQNRAELEEQSGWQKERQYRQREDYY